MQNIQGRWFPNVLIYKDMLKEGKGTKLIIENIQFNVTIPANIFNIGNLK